MLDVKQNFSGINTAGIDWMMGYCLPIAKDYERFKLTFDSNFLLRYDQITPLGGDRFMIDHQASTAQQSADTPLPRFKANSTLTWAKSSYSAAFSTRYVHSVVEPCDDGREPSLVSLGLCIDPTHRDKDGVLAPQNRLRPAVYNDLQLGYNFKPQKLDFAIGVNNVFNQEPPVARTAALSNSFTSTIYEIPGRQPYLRLKKDF